MDYELPTAEISELDAYKDFMKLKGIRWNELLKENEWFQSKKGEKSSSSHIPVGFLISVIIFFEN